MAKRSAPARRPASMPPKNMPGPMMSGPMMMPEKHAAMRAAGKSRKK